MARKFRLRNCMVCGNPHGRSKCPVAELNAQQELTAAMEKTDLIDLGLTPQLEYQIRAIRRGWKEQGQTVTIASGAIQKTVPALVLDAQLAAERLRQAWGVRA